MGVLNPVGRHHDRLVVSFRHTSMEEDLTPRANLQSSWDALIDPTIQKSSTWSPFQSAYIQSLLISLYSTIKSWAYSLGYRAS